MCNTIDRNYLLDRLPTPYINESVELCIDMVKENDEKRCVSKNSC